MKANARSLIPVLGIFSFLIFLGMSCQPFLYRNSNDCGSNYSGSCDRYRDYSYSYGYQNRIGYPYYYRNQSYGTNGGGGHRHNPMHIPSGRFHNVGRPSHWKL
ncbi:hypothetical protein A0128_10475 [Leptospira tipperaryensis]|uniref:Lipoprotein n=1 Tax=Leptospira tipperaryensis TaxID=2564040 RepID=A0A1D7UXC0_9LEPT|nr:hypothetical protein [Leptospira tipperaryensis]AOP34233.1 hypothetical protein A0128_10475 [Leptospira tipperaryensis]